MMLAVRFETWPLLIGAAAAAIPLVLHLLASVRARQAPFPTLRFLHLCMKKTSRRRRIQHWLLLAVRSALLALLAVGLAEPITSTVPTRQERPAKTRYAAVLIIDNSLSMNARDSSEDAGKPARVLTRFEKAKADAKSLLLGDNAPAAAAVVLTNEMPESDTGTETDRLELTEDMAALVRRIAERTATATLEAQLADRLRRAVQFLEGHPEYEDRAIYVFSDMQRTSFENIAEVEELAKARGIRLAFIRAAKAEARNVSVANLSVMGRCMVDEEMEIEGRLVNSSPCEMEPTVRLAVNDKAEGKDRRVALAPGGQAGSAADVKFSYTPRQAGPLTVEVMLAGGDDLAEDNRRSVSLTIDGRSRVLVVRGPAGRADPPGYEPAAALLVALQPFADASEAWPIVVRPREGIDASKFAPADLTGADAAFFCDVPDFTPEQAAAIEGFAKDGGTVAFFLGPNVRPDSYNQLLPALLPGQIRPAVGQVAQGNQGQMPARLDATHPLLAGLYKSAGEYPAVYVSRYFPVAAGAGKVEVPIRHARAAVDPAGDPLVMVRQFGRGQVILCTTTASPVWGNLCGRPIFLPMVVRMSLRPRAGRLGDRAFTPGEKVTVAARVGSPDAAAVRVRMPGGQVEQAQAAGTPGTFAFSRTMQLGRYDWSVEGAAAAEAGASGSFAVCPQQAECNLQSVKDDALKQSLAARGVTSVYVGPTLPAAEAAAPQPAGPRERNWWDVFLSLVIMLLVVEAAAANRFRRRDAEAAEHLKPAGAK